MGTSPLSLSFTLLLSWLCMKEATCLLPVIHGCESVCDILHFELVHHPPTSSPTHMLGSTAGHLCLFSIFLPNLSHKFSPLFSTFAAIVLSTFTLEMLLYYAVAVVCALSLWRQMFFFWRTKE